MQNRQFMAPGIVALVLPCVGMAASSVEYYVSPQGNDEGVSLTAGLVSRCIHCGA